MSEDNDGTREKVEDPFAAERQSLSNRLSKVSNEMILQLPSVLAPETRPDELDLSGRMEKPAGQMLIGARVPSPVVSGTNIEDALKTKRLFSSSGPERVRVLSGGTAIAVICIAAAGLTSGVAVMIDKNAASDASGQLRTAMDTDATKADSANGQAKQENLTTPVASVARLEDQLMADPKQVAVIRLAQKANGSLSIEDVSGESGRPIPLRISVAPDEQREYAFVMLRGLPYGFELSAGFRLKESWAVSLKDLTDLTLEAPEGYAGRLELEALLVKGRNTPVEARVMTLNIGNTAKLPEQITETVATPEVQVPSIVPQIVATVPSTQIDTDRSGLGEPPVSESAPPKLLIAAEEESAMLERGLQLLGNGDVASARLILEHIAKKGSGKGALALAQTYDPVFFRSINTVGGLQPDSEQARKWYSVALQLGQEGARERLTILSRQ